MIPRMHCVFFGFSGQGCEVNVTSSMTCRIEVVKIDVTWRHSLRGLAVRPIQQQADLLWPSGCERVIIIIYIYIYIHTYNYVWLHVHISSNVSFSKLFFGVYTTRAHTHTCSLNPQLVRVSPANCPDHSRASSKKMLSATAAPRWAAKKNWLLSLLSWYDYMILYTSIYTESI